ncbi:PREDICTED: extensin-like [Cyprinodon variegatus]|uniref:extensin-like n=1 Tax=Cyprinodon variegatus TaxID=28743 RepID=UPI000742B3A5|nr:PREDICTED: extensin-like [Cyprinodon variegatus]
MGERSCDTATPTLLIPALSPAPHPAHGLGLPEQELPRDRGPPIQNPPKKTSSTSHYMPLLPAFFGESRSDSPATSRPPRPRSHPQPKPRTKWPTLPPGPRLYMAAGEQGYVIKTGSTKRGCPAQSTPLLVDRQCQCTPPFDNPEPSMSRCERGRRKPTVRSNHSPTLTFNLLTTQATKDIQAEIIPTPPPSPSPTSRVHTPEGNPSHPSTPEAAAGAESWAYTGPDPKQYSPQNPKPHPGPRPRAMCPRDPRPTQQRQTSPPNGNPTDSAPPAREGPSGPDRYNT